MENATKALIIAASILIAIVLIGIGLRVLNSSSEPVEQVRTQSETVAIQTFNSQFTKYTGTQAGSEVKALLSLAAATARNGSEHTVTIIIGATPYTGTGIASAINSISTTATYTVNITGTDGEGYITEITIG